MEAIESFRASIQRILDRELLVDWGEDGKYRGIISKYDATHPRAPWTIYYPKDGDEENGIFKRNFTEWHVEDEENPDDPFTVRRILKWRDGKLPPSMGLPEQPRLQQSGGPEGRVNIRAQTAKSRLRSGRVAGRGKMQNAAAATVAGGSPPTETGDGGDGGGSRGPSAEPAAGREGSPKVERGAAAEEGTGNGPAVSSEPPAGSGAGKAAGRASRDPRLAKEPNAEEDGGADAKQLGPGASRPPPLLTAEQLAKRKMFNPGPPPRTGGLGAVPTAKSQREAGYSGTVKLDPGKPGGASGPGLGAGSAKPARPVAGMPVPAKLATAAGVSGAVRGSGSGATAVAAAAATVKSANRVARGFFDKLKELGEEAAVLAPEGCGGDATGDERVAGVLSRRLHVLYVMDSLLYRSTKGQEAAMVGWPHMLSRGLQSALRLKAVTADHVRAVRKVVEVWKRRDKLDGGVLAMAEAILAEQEGLLRPESQQHLQPPQHNAQQQQGPQAANGGPGQDGGDPDGGRGHLRRRKHYIVALPRPVRLHRILYGSSSSGYGGCTEMEEYYVNGFGPLANRCMLDNPYGSLSGAHAAGGAAAGEEGAAVGSGKGEPWGRLVEVDFALDDDEPDFSGSGRRGAQHTPSVTRYPGAASGGQAFGTPLMSSGAGGGGDAALAEPPLRTTSGPPIIGLTPPAVDDELDTPQERDRDRDRHYDRERDARERERQEQEWQRERDRDRDRDRRSAPLPQQQPPPGRMDARDEPRNVGRGGRGDYRPPFLPPPQPGPPHRGHHDPHDRDRDWERQQDRDLRDHRDSREQREQRVQREQEREQERERGEQRAGRGRGEPAPAPQPPRSNVHREQERTLVGEDSADGGAKGGRDKPQHDASAAVSGHPTANGHSAVQHASRAEPSGGRGATGHDKAPLEPGGGRQPPAQTQEHGRQPPAGGGTGGAGGGGGKARLRPGLALRLSHLEGDDADEEHLHAPPSAGHGGGGKRRRRGSGDGEGRGGRQKRSQSPMD
eukprot:XP_001689462.1 predicted protein [Chlamydomonas reinhardtii]